MARVWQRQLSRALHWHLGRTRFATSRHDGPLPHKIYRHQSKLRKTLGTDPAAALWQDNKAHNHALAIPHLHQSLIKPGETFSIWRLVGRPSSRKGDRKGMELHLGRPRGGIGGGLCQIANLLHWLALHSPLVVTQRASHSFHPFPDQGRVIPYGTGAALFYNYIDLWLFHPTETTFQINIWLTNTLLNGETRGSAQLPHRYRIHEENAGFTQNGGQWYRNHVRVLYQPSAAMIAGARGHKRD